MIFSHVLYQLSYLGDRKDTSASQSGAFIGARRNPVQRTAWRLPSAAVSRQGPHQGYCGGRAEISFNRSLSLLITAMSLHCALLRWVHSIVTL